jgi:hypothetical protein
LHHGALSRSSGVDQWSRDQAVRVCCAPQVHRLAHAAVHCSRLETPSDCSYQMRASTQ